MKTEVNQRKDAEICIAGLKADSLLKGVYEYRITSGTYSISISKRFTDSNLGRFITQTHLSLIEAIANKFGYSFTGVGLSIFDGHLEIQLDPKY